MTEKRYLTLIELVISLAILAAVSSVLLTNFIDDHQREREKVTRERGEAVRTSVLGGRGKFGEYLSDMGRWPEVFYERDSYGNLLEEYALSQLYDRTIWYHGSSTESMFTRVGELELGSRILDLPVSTNFRNYIYPTVRMSIGWRGNYLNLGKTSKAKYSDGWGRGWRVITNYYLDKADGEDVLAEYYDELTELSNVGDNPQVFIDGVVSYGADGLEGGSKVSDIDQYFLFPRSLQSADLNVVLKVRDEFDPSYWNELDVREISEYVQGSTYQKGEVVYQEFGGDKYYYTSISSDNKSMPCSTSITPEIVNFGWRYGTPANVVSKDSVRVLIFSPAKRKLNNNGTAMEIGYINIKPNLSTSENQEKYTPLLYAYKNNAGNMVIGEDIDSYLDRRNLENSNLYFYHNWQYDQNIIGSLFQVRGLIPGRRMIYGFVGFHNGNSYMSMAASSLEWVELLPGDNKVTIYLKSIK
ncbi:MAG: type II secretion system protein [Lentisphaeria bacterium]